MKTFIFSRRCETKRCILHSGLVLMIILTAALHNTSCVELVTDVDFPDQDPKVVVHSFISPADTTVMVLLTWSIPVTLSHNQGNLRFIDNARVVISGGQQAGATLIYDADRKIYSVPSDAFRVEGGNEYQLFVDVPGQVVVSASCFVPHPNNSLQFFSIDTIAQDWSQRIIVEYGFTDDAQEHTNYYAPSAYREELVHDWQNEVDVYHKIPFEPVNHDNYFSNTKKEGQDFLLRAESWYYDYSDGSTNDPEQPRIITLLLLVTDEHYYRYHRGLETHYPDDFFSEASHVYSNIEGGLGVFAGYNRTELILEWID